VEGEGERSGTATLRVTGTHGIGDARRHAVDVAAKVLDGDRLHDVALVVSELVANALEHGQGHADVVVRLSGDGVEITVGSPSDGRLDGGLDLEDEPVAASERRGRGLRIVNSLTDTMVVRSVDDHIEVTVRFDRS
jgi:anti-sigma regulatory factor (Ser/Thr protein kinase)